ncbi:hypothetical protein N665_0275s0057 [Sinapis alba]|nr:hypothetical protein N665_0275s0057 [Sinapis alba]
MKFTFSLTAVDKKNTYRKLHVSAKKVSGLEEAIRIRRMREAESNSKVKRSPPLRYEFQIPGPEGLAKMRAASELAAQVLNFAGTLVKPSVTTNEIDKAVHDMIVEAGAYPSPLGYGGFPKSVCTSWGYIININATVYLDGYHGDTSRTLLCGEVDEGFKRLVKVTEECLEKGIAVCKLDEASFKKIGKRISEHADKYGYNVVERFVGHGNNKLMMGLTTDGGVAAQFEHTILITRSGSEILTIC